MDAAWSVERAADFELAERLGIAELAIGPGLDGAGRAAMPRLRGRVVAIALAETPRLRAGTADGAERARWADTTQREIERANHWECPRVIADLGALDAIIDLGWRQLCEQYARGLLDDGRRRRFLDARSEPATRALDHARRMLEPLFKHCERNGVALRIPPAARGDDLGLAPEIAALVEGFRGAPIAAWGATDRQHILDTVGLQTSRVRAGQTQRASPVSRGAWLTDACALLGGLLPDRGEIDFANATADMEPPWVLRAAQARDDEVAASLRWARDFVKA